MKTMILGLLFLLSSSLAQGGYTIDPYSQDERGRLWEGGIVPYTIDPSLDRTSRDRIMQSIADFHAKTTIKWVPRKAEKDYVLFALATFKAEGGATLGRMVGKQTIYLQQGGGYAGTGTIIHEMGHTVGLMHEHTHPDILKWVTFTGDFNKQWDKMCWDFFLGHTGSPETTAFTTTTSQTYSLQALLDFAGEAKNGAVLHFDVPRPGGLQKTFDFAAAEPQGRSHYFRWDSESIMSTAHGCWLNPPNDSRGWPAVLKVKPGYPGKPVVRDAFVLSKGDAITINALYADKTPNPNKPAPCEDDSRVGTPFCVGFKAKGDCESYSMHKTAWYSCKATCGICKDAPVVETKPPVPSMCVELKELFKQNGCSL